MTESAGKELRPELRAWFETWKTCAQGVLSQVSGQTIALEISSEPLPRTDSDLWYTVVAGGVVHGEMTLRLASDSAVRLAQKFLGETEPSGGPTADHKEALEELLRQIAGQCATTLGPSLGGELQLHTSSSSVPSWSSAAAVSLRTRDEAGTPVCLEIQVNAALAAALEPQPEAGLTEPPAEPPAVSPIPVDPHSYDRLMDVGLEVKLRFGSRRMALRDVLSLSAGLVVELDSHVNAPVDLLLDSRVIAQGEVVVVDGKYGLRVTEVLSRA